MKTKVTILLVLAAFIVLFTGTPIAQAAEASVGVSAPEFSLSDINGTAHSLAAYKGKYVVLEWVNHDCPFVKKHYDSQNMQNLQKEYTEKDVVWLSVNSSAPGKQGNFSAAEWSKLTAEKGASPTAVLLDENGAVGQAYGAKTTPHMYVVNPEGVLIYQGAIDSISSADKGDIAAAQNYVRSALDEAMSGKQVSTPSTQSYGCSVKY